jgi:hypothetical protein
MTDILVEIDTALLAKEKGFYWPTPNYLEGSERHWVKMFKPLPNKYNLFKRDITEKVSWPTQSHLQKWLREGHNIHFWFMPVETRRAAYGKLSGAEIIKAVLNKDGPLDYEQALEKSLREGLKLL